MEKIESFTINHLTLMPGLYVSRRDSKGGTVATTFDMRYTAPNREPVMDTGTAHTIEHLCATYLRNSSIKEDVVYFGPMGCRTGFYLVLFGEKEPGDILELIKTMQRYVIGFEGEIPGATAKECGNYSDQNLSGAKAMAKKYLAALTENPCTEYPE